MFTLVTDQSRFFKVKHGQSGGEVERALSLPVSDVFAGKIIERGQPLVPYTVKPLESYKSLAEKFGLTEEELKSINLSRPLYPTCRLYVPCKNRRVSI